MNTWARTKSTYRARINIESKQYYMNKRNMHGYEDKEEQTGNGTGRCTHQRKNRKCGGTLSKNIRVISPFCAHLYEGASECEQDQQTLALI